MCHLVIFPQNKMDPDQARQRDFLLDPNRWYIVYLKFVFEKGKIKKKRLKEKKRRL